jgi:hypothetical protein
MDVKLHSHAKEKAQVHTIWENGAEDYIGPKRDKIIVEWIQVHNEGLHSFTG